MIVPVDMIRDWRDHLAYKVSQTGARMFMGKPDAWFDDLHWFCPNGHVSGRYLSGDRVPSCLACDAPVIMGPRMSEDSFKQLLDAMALFREIYEIYPE